MRRLVVAVIVVAAVLSLAGCSSGSSTSSTTAPPSGTEGGAPAVAATTAVLPVLDNRSAKAPDTFTPFPTGADVPDVLKQKVTNEKQPTLIYFYDSSHTSHEVRSIIDDVRYENRGLVDLVVFDLSKYVTANPDGTLQVDPGLATDAAGKQAVMFARDPAIGVSYTPFIVLTDSQGYIIYRHAGLVDSAFLEREVQRAAE